MLFAELVHIASTRTRDANGHACVRPNKFSLPLRAKLHSKRLADEYVRLGWRIELEFRMPGDDEPYEIILVWPGPSGPVYPEAG